jgi:3-isopropylmalate/(R)-2-methylmalate dehydratase large subunit
MAMTIIEQILSRHSGGGRVSPGDIVACDIDMAVQTDLGFIYSPEVAVPLKLHDPAKVAIVLDHRAPAKAADEALGHARAREYARKWGIRNFYDIGRHGICHQVILEQALALPGQILVCSDSHTLASGALNCAARGFGTLDLTQAFATGQSWFRCAPTARIVLEGEKSPAVSGKDIFLYMASWLGSMEGLCLEFGGPGLACLSMDQRSSLATMCTELSADFAVFPADAVTLAYLSARTDQPLEPVAADEHAEYAAVHVLDLASVVPHVARPDFLPHNTEPVAGFAERVAIHQAYVGSCANGKLEDLRVAARILEGRRVADGVRMIVTPASQQVYMDAVKAGYVGTIVAAGAVVTNSTCGACAGGHMGVLAPDEVCITSSTRNFRGRMGSADARIYMGSTATVAASAVAGYITDPTPFLSSGGTA